jgi:hypothetical protein
VKLCEAILASTFVEHYEPNPGANVDTPEFTLSVELELVIIAPDQALLVVVRQHLRLDLCNRSLIVMRQIKIYAISMIHKMPPNKLLYSFWITPLL